MAYHKSNRAILPHRIQENLGYGLACGRADRCVIVLHGEQKPKNEEPSEDSRDSWERYEAMLSDGCVDGEVVLTDGHYNAKGSTHSSVVRLFGHLDRGKHLSKSSCKEGGPTCALASKPATKTLV